MSRPYINWLIIICFVVSIILLVITAMPVLANQQTAEQDTLDSGEVESMIKSASKGQLVVPVYPRGTDSKILPEGADLRDSYIVLEDGSVLSVADWILGSLNKDKSGIAMTDYENRLFLGQVARAAAGLDENLINRSLVYAHPTLKYKKAPALKGVAGATQSLASFILGVIMPPMPKNYDPSKEGGAFNPTLKVRGDSTIIFDEWFAKEMDHDASEFKELGIMQNMLETQRKKLEEKPE